MEFDGCIKMHENDWTCRCENDWTCFFLAVLFYCRCFCAFLLYPGSDNAVPMHTLLLLPWLRGAVVQRSLSSTLPIAESAKTATTSSMNLMYPQKIKKRELRIVVSKMSPTLWLRQGVPFFLASGFHDFALHVSSCCVQNGSGNWTFIIQFYKMHLDHIGSSWSIRDMKDLWNPLDVFSSLFIVLPFISI